MKRTAIIALGLGLSAFASAGVLSVKATAMSPAGSWNQSWGGLNDSIWAPVTSAIGSVGGLIQGGFTPTNGLTNNSINASVYQKASFQFGFYTATNEAPPSNLYMHYAGSTISNSLQPYGPYQSYGSQTIASSTFPNTQSKNTWNLTARYGAVESSPPYSAAVSAVTVLPSSAFGGWTLVKSSGGQKWYVSTGTWMMTTPTASAGGVLGSGTQFSSGAGWGFGYIFLIS